jgi:hypothetical protein
MINTGYPPLHVTTSDSTMIYEIIILLNQMKDNKHHTLETVLKSNIKIKDAKYITHKN